MNIQFSNDFKNQQKLIDPNRENRLDSKTGMDEIVKIKIYNKFLIRILVMKMVIQTIILTVIIIIFIIIQ